MKVLRLNSYEMLLLLYYHIHRPAVFYAEVIPSNLRI
jgi:hypothetical protein